MGRVIPSAVCRLGKQAEREHTAGSVCETVFTAITKACAEPFRGVKPSVLPGQFNKEKRLCRTHKWKGQDMKWYSQYDQDHIK